jgi:hypothetical protein
MQRRKTWIHKKKEIQMMIYVTMITQMRQVLIPRNCSLILPRKMINKTRQKVRIKNLEDSRKPTINNLKKGPVGQDTLIIKKAKKNSVSCHFHDSSQRFFNSHCITVNQFTKFLNKTTWVTQSGAGNY